MLKTASSRSTGRTRFSGPVSHHGKSRYQHIFIKKLEATIELMQANSGHRFLNMQIFAGLLGCVRKICIGRLIGHLAIVEIEDVSQHWYRDFFRLAGFHRCRCQSSAGSTLQPETRNCLSSSELLDIESSTVNETVRIWLAEGRCTSALLDSVASGEAAEVERKYFHDLRAELQDEKHL